MRATFKPARVKRSLVIGCVVSSLGWISLSSVSEAQAETFAMTCKNSRYTYRVSFDDETQRFQWASDAGKVDYLVLRYKVEEQGVTVWGKVRRFGNDFVAFFSEEGWIKNLYANGSSMIDVCRGKS